MKKTLLEIRAKFFRWLHHPRMLNNIYINNDGTHAKNTRFSSTVNFVNRQNIILGDNIYIGNNVILDGTSSLFIENGCQISANVSILTHSSHISIRLFGENYSECKGTKEDGYVLGKVKIEKYTFIGTNAIIGPNVHIGKGCIVGANSYVNSNLPDYSIAYGTPAKIVGDSRRIDSEYLNKSQRFQEYYNEWNNE
ncbi:MAG TPA: acyltransferase [Arcobacter sp.]|nr:acyltransferase [Arcobacter sp.]